nr:DUF2344 domain-containing protein [uncultured Holophaga sp.]
MQKSGTSSGSDLVQAFLAWSERPEGELQPWLERLEAAGKTEEALVAFRGRWKGLRPPPQVREALESAAELSRQRRIHQWQQDPQRRTLRVRLSIQGSATQLRPPALISALARGFEEAGVPLAMGLGKPPRPQVQLGPALPLGVPGALEWADLTLSGPLRGGLPEEPLAGLRVLGWEEIPNYATSVLELAHRARWRWDCPGALRQDAGARLASFMEATSYTIEKTGKSEGRKVVKQLEVRPLVLDLAWEGDVLHFSTRLAAGEALNPQKLLGGILGVDPALVQPLAREGVELAEDPRLHQAHRYQTKLHNIFEDAVLLEGGGNITLVDEDDEEPLRL